MLFKVLPAPPDKSNSVDVFMESEVALRDREIDELLKLQSSPDAVGKALRDSVLVQSKAFDLYSRELVNDLLIDVRCLQSDDIENNTEGTGMIYNFQSEFSRATKIDIATGKYYHTSPFYAKDKFAFEIETKDSVYVLNALSSYAMWSWVRALRVAIKHWRDSKSNLSWPNDRFQAYLEIELSGKVNAGVGTVCLSKPFELQFDSSDNGIPISGIFGAGKDSRSIDLTDMVSIVVSCDYGVPTGYMLQVEIEKSGSESAKRRESTSSSENPSHNSSASHPSGHLQALLNTHQLKFIIDRSLFGGSFLKASSVVKGGATGMVGAVKGVAGGVASIVATGTAIATGSSTSAAHFVVAKAPFHPFFETSKVFAKADRLVDLDPWKQIFSIYVNEEDLYPSSNNKAHGLSLFLWENHMSFEKVTGSGLGGDKITGEVTIPYSKLFETETDEDQDSAFGEEKAPAFGRKYKSEVALNTRNGYRVTLVNAFGLPVPSTTGFTSSVTRALDTTTTILQFGQRGLFIPTVKEDVRDCYVKTTLVKWNGERDYAAKSKRFVSSVKRGTLTPKWNETYEEAAARDYSKNKKIGPPKINEEYFFVADPGLHSAEFICLELFDARNAASAQLEERLGAVFIPLVDFSLQEIDKEFKITSSKPLPAYLKNCGLGKMTVRIQKVQELEDNYTKCLSLNSTLYASSIYNTMWYTRCIPSGVLDRSKEDLARLEEIFLLYPSFAGLVLKEHSYINKKSESNVTSFYEDDPLGDPQTIIMLAYENQRRSLIPRTEFACDNLLSNDRGALSNESGNRLFPEDTLAAVKPPTGYVWVGDWEIDRKYTCQDSDGWSYGINFNYIMSNLRRGKSTTNHHGRTTRRRKWIRFAKKHNATGQESSAFLPSMNHFDYFQHEVEYKKNPDRLLGLCQERDKVSFDIIIPWNQVISHAVVTPSVLSITATIHRYFAASSISAKTTKSAHQSVTSASFKTAEVELFVTNCPASDLHYLLLERSEVFEDRENVKQLLSEGVMSIERQNSATDTTDEVDEGEEEDQQIATVELSLGSETIQKLDSEAFKLENDFEELLQYWEHEKRSKEFQFSLTGQSEVIEWSTASDFREQMTKEKYCGSGKSGTESFLSRWARRSSRYRVYIGTLLASGLQGQHDFEEDVIDKLMQKDFATAKRICIDDPEYGDTNKAFDMIEYLLDAAETRIRDSILCGWGKSNGPLEKCLGLMINGYYVEIVALLSKFFESKGLEAVKGVERKKALISFFLKHNDRLSDMLVSALRPFRLVVDPEPDLSRLLNIDDLVNFYTTILLTEMTDYVDKVLNRCKVNSREDAQEAGCEFSAILPWYPIKTGDIFSTTIPEDVASALVEYLKSSIISEEGNDKFESLLAKLDSKVLIGSSTAYLHLAEEYRLALRSRDWTLISVPLKSARWKGLVSLAENEDSEDLTTANESEEGNLEDHAMFLCSVANDAYRVCSNQLIESDYSGTTTANGMFKKEKSRVHDSDAHNVIKRAYHNFDRIKLEAVENLSCLLFKPADQLSAPNFQSQWLADSSVMRSCFDRILDDFKFYASFLNEFSALEFLKVFSKKMIIVFLFLVRELSDMSSGSFTRPVCEKFINDVEYTKKALVRLYSDQTTREAIEVEFSFLDQIVVLLSHDLRSEAFVMTLENVLEHASQNALDSRAYSSLIESCMQLRVDKGNLNSVMTPREDNDEEEEDDVSLAQNSIFYPIIVATRKIYNQVASEVKEAKVPGLSKRSSLWLVFANSNEGYRDLCMLPLKVILTQSVLPVSELRKLDGNTLENLSSTTSRRLSHVENVIKSIWQARITNDTFIKQYSFMEEENSQPTHRIEITLMKGFDFPSLSYAGKPSSFISGAISGSDIQQSTELIKGQSPEWLKSFVFEVMGYVHRELKLSLIYKAQYFGKDTEVGVVIQPLLGIDVSRNQTLKHFIKTNSNPEIQKNVNKAIGQGKECLALEFSIKIISLITSRP